MLQETLKLAENINAETENFAYSEKNKGAGYAGRLDTTTTVQYILDNFSGAIKIQGSLELYPGDDDWVDIEDTLIDDVSSVLNDDYTISFTGNFLWLRAAYQITNGTISSIRYNL